jgi:PST family polysaccharide transporter
MSVSTNLRWVGVSQVFRVFLQFFSIWIFSRLLLPADFGILAMASIVTNFATLFRDMGSSAALIQRSELTQRLVDTTHALNLAFGSGLALLVALSAPLAAWYFGEPRLLPVLLLLALSFPITSFGTSAMALLERHGAFRAIARIELTSAVVGIICTTAAALSHFGVYSLVVQSLSVALCSSVQFRTISPRRPQMKLDRHEFREIWSFSGNLMGFNLINYFSRNADSFLIGRYLGPTNLGVYSLAIRLLLFPLQNITFVMNRALYPIYSRIREDSGEMKKIYLASLRHITIIVCPMMFLLWALRDPLVVFVFGPKWRATGDILAWFAPMGYLQALLATTGTIYTALGRTDTLRRVGFVNTSILLFAFVIGLHWGVNGVAEAYFIATFVISFYSVEIALRQVGASLLDLARMIMQPLAAALMMAAIVTVLDRYSGFAPRLPIIRLFCELGAGMLIYAAGLSGMYRELSAAIRPLVGLSPPRQRPV